jgi:SAM-dependent methyltransferase
METVVCATCGGDRTNVLFCKWGFNIVQCQNCGLCYVNPRTFNVESDAYFSGPYLASIEEGGSVKPAIEQTYSNVLTHLNTYLRPGRLLDVGCGMGHFMVQARRGGWNCQGVECSQFAASYARKRWDLRIHPVCDLSEARLPDNHFDACVLMGVAEHLPHPRNTLTQVFHLLKPGGMLHITAPNFSSFRALLEREDWSAIIPTGRLYYFTAESLGRILRAAGFERLVNLTPPSSLEAELEAIRRAGRAPLPEDLVNAVRQKCSAEDARRYIDTRGEGLVMCAIKPRSPYSPIQASLRFSDTMIPLEGKLVSSPGQSADDQRVYLIYEGRKHWVTSVDWLQRHSMTLDQTVQVNGEMLQSILSGAPLV